MSIDECYEQYMVMAMIISQVTEGNEFLEAKGRNSVCSKVSYTSALKHLQDCR